MANAIKDTVKYLHDCGHGGGVLLSQVPPPSIYMVPSVARRLSPSSFTPRVVSIGPLHRQDANLHGFEVEKMKYLHKLLDRFQGEPKQTLERCVEKVIGLIGKIKACYGGLTTYSDFELATMMVIDGCFILEFIQSLPDESYKRMIPVYIIYDLLLIENQIPFFVLQIIFDCTNLSYGSGEKEGWTLTKHIKDLLFYYNVFERDFKKAVPNVNQPAESNHTVELDSTVSTHEHILGFFHKFHQPVQPNSSDCKSIPKAHSNSSESKSNPKAHSVMDLHRAGMSFKPNEDKNWSMAMEVKKPIFLCTWFPCLTLKMPVVAISDSTELVLRNLIIYEQFSNVTKFVTSYVCALDMLIDTPEDVAQLIKSKVLYNHLGSNQDAADMINQLCKEILIQDFCYDEQWEDMDVYYNSYWPNTIAWLKRKYFNNPWSFIALTAAIILFGLTTIQTIFTVKAAS